MWWGYSPALDILEEYESAVGPTPRESPVDAGPWGDSRGAVDVLLVGCADGRHQLRTAARRWRRPDPLLHCLLTWHVAEPLPELYARQLLLWSVASAPASDLGPRQRVRLFLELYGNSVLRARSAAFLTLRGAQLAHVVADEELLRAHFATSLEPMRHRERDHIQDTCLLWRSPASRTSMRSLWDARLRRHLGTRYDSRQGAFDWDYHMRLRELCGDHVTLREYKHWRETGVAFAWLETECSLPNASMLSWVDRAHGEICHRGYCGDIESGPFPAFGDDCSDDPDFDKTCNGGRIKSSRDIAERNLHRLFHELHTASPYDPPKEEDNRTVCITELPSARDDWVGADESLLPDVDAGARAASEAEGGSVGAKAATQATPPLQCSPPPRTRTYFLPQDAIVKYPQKPRHKQTFDVIVLAQGLSHWLKPNVVSMARPGALVLVEGKRWVVSTRRQEVLEHGQRLDKLAKEAGCVPVHSFDPLEDNYAVFRVQWDEKPSLSAQVSS